MTLRIDAPIDTTQSCLVQQSCEIIDGHSVIDYSAYDVLRYLKRLEDLVLTIGNSQGELFAIQPKTHHGMALWHLQGATLVGRRTLAMLQPNAQWTQIRSNKDHDFSPEIQLWIKTLAQYELEAIGREDCVYADKNVLEGLLKRLTQCVEAIRKAVCAPDFRETKRQLTKRAKKNMASAQRWLDRIFAHHANLLVIRVDLAYQKDYQLDSGDLHAVTVAETFEHRERFLRALPRWIAQDALLGYAINTEFTLRRSIHHHCLVIVDGSKLGSDVVIAKIIGKRWIEEITQGRGDYFNVNAKYDHKASECGIGKVHVSDAAKVFNLRYRVLAYLLKPDYLVRWVLPKSRRLFLKSVARALMGPKPGRPRQDKGGEQ